MVPLQQYEKHGCSGKEGYLRVLVGLNERGCAVGAMVKVKVCMWEGWYDVG